MYYLCQGRQHSQSAASFLDDVVTRQLQKREKKPRVKIYMLRAEMVSRFEDLQIDGMDLTSTHFEFTASCRIR